MRRGLRALQRTVARLRGHRLSPSCADGLTGAIDAAFVHAERWLAAPSLH